MRNWIRAKAAADEARARLNRAERSVELNQEQPLLCNAGRRYPRRRDGDPDRRRPSRGVRANCGCVARFAEKEAVVAIPGNPGRAGEKIGVASVTLWSETDKKYAAKLPRGRAVGRSRNTNLSCEIFTARRRRNRLARMTATLTLADPATTRVARLPLSALFSQAASPRSISSMPRATWR